MPGCADTVRALRPSSCPPSSRSSPKGRNRRVVVFLTSSWPQSTAADLATSFFHGTGGTTRTQSSRSLRDPETACNAFVGLHSTTTESDPGKKGPCQDAPAAKTVPIACNGLCLTVCFASSIASSAAWRPCLIAWLADRTPSPTASVTLDLILETSRRGLSTIAGFSNTFASIRFTPSPIPTQVAPECKSFAKKRVALFSARCTQRKGRERLSLGRYRENLH